MISNINLEKINNKIDNVQLNINRYNKYINNFQNGNNNNEIKKKYLNKINLKINNLNDHLNNVKKYDNNKDIHNLIIKGKEIINKFNNLSGGGVTNENLLQQVLGYIKNPPKKETTELKNLEYLNKLINATEYRSRQKSVKSKGEQQESVKPKDEQEKAEAEQDLPESILTSLGENSLTEANIKTIKLKSYIKYINKNSQNIKEIYKYTAGLLSSFLKIPGAIDLFINKNPHFMYYLQSFIDIVGFMYYRRFPYIQKINLVACILNGESDKNKYLTDGANIVESKTQMDNKYKIKINGTTTDMQDTIVDVLNTNLIFHSVFSELLDLHNVYDPTNDKMKSTVRDYQHLLASRIIKLFNLANMSKLYDGIFQMLIVCADIMTDYSNYDENKIQYDQEIYKYIAKNNIRARLSWDSV